MPAVTIIDSLRDDHTSVYESSSIRAPDADELVVQRYLHFCTMPFGTSSPRNFGKGKHGARAPLESNGGAKFKLLGVVSYNMSGMH